MKVEPEKLFTSRYSDLSEEKTSGATYTPKRLAVFVAKQIISALIDFSHDHLVEVLDPACGDGELLVSIATELKSSGFTRISLFGFETSQTAIAHANHRIEREHPDVEVDLQFGNFLESIIDTDMKSLFTSALLRKYDIVIANPPYVRTQTLGASEAKKLAAMFGLKGRVDLYYPFVLGIGMVLRERGVAGIITSNRYMTTKAGASVREAVHHNFKILQVWDLGDTKIFDAAVLPAILLVTAPDPVNAARHGVTFTSIYETKLKECAVALDPIDALEKEGVVRISDGRCFEVKRGLLDDGGAAGGVWRLSTGAGDEWLRVVAENTWGTFETIGKIRVGVKTTADDVFVHQDWEAMPPSERPELLRPLTTHHISRQFKAAVAERRRWILYPHECMQGKRRPIDLTAYPKSRDFLERYRERLTSRTYVIEAKRRWYEVWVPQDPAAWPRPKLVMRDISEEPCFWLDLDGSVINGDCYWIVAPEGKEDLLWLAAGVANSKFIEEFYDHKFNNKLYSGRRRFMTQYVAQFPLPDPLSSSATQIVTIAKRIYDVTPGQEAVYLTKKLDLLVREAFGVNVLDAGAN